MSRLLELNELQSRRAVDDDRSWPQAIIDSVTVGFSEYAVVGTLERHSEESRALLELCRRVVDRWAGTIGERRDVVHWDYTLDNVLAERDRVTGIVDWGGTRSGDRLFDLATLVSWAGFARALEPEGASTLGRQARHARIGLRGVIARVRPDRTSARGSSASVAARRRAT
jgi:aminoglycoside phosphotransferase (APT) family kinase protein